MVTSHYYGELSFGEGLRLQQKKGDFLRENPQDKGSVLLLSHAPTITLGKHAKSSDVRISSEQCEALGIEIHRINRGGGVTYHGPEQLIIYPVVRLHTGTVFCFLETIATAIINACNDYGLYGAEFCREPGLGLWFGGKKLASCGVHISRKIVTHGFAVNVRAGGIGWPYIIPCGMPSSIVTSLEENVEHTAPTVEEFAQTMMKTLVRCDPASISV